MRFLQFADVHLDSCSGGAAGLPPEKRAELRRDLRTAFTRACAAALEHRAELVLIPGDLFDYESAGPDTGAFIAETLAGLAPVPVFIAPGNHDSLRPGNPYLAGGQWPANVTILTAPEFTHVRLPNVGCSVTGIAHAHRGITDRVLSRRIDRTDEPVGILLFHGSRDTFGPSGKENVIPFSDQELLAQGFTYAAIGHYHSFSQITCSDGLVRAAYSGCVQGRGLDECGGKCVLVGDIDAQGRATLTQLEVAPRRLLRIEVEVTGSTTNDEVLGRLDSALALSGARECDIVEASLVGSLPVTLELETTEWESGAHYFHVSVSRSRIRAEYDLAAIAGDSAASSLKSEFVRRLLELEGQTEDAREKRILQEAVYYGLCALEGRKPEPRDAY